MVIYSCLITYLILDEFSYVLVYFFYFTFKRLYILKENEHLKFVLDNSAITLHEDIPLPEIDILFNDDFGPLTAAEALQM